VDQRAGALRSAGQQARAEEQRNCAPFLDEEIGLLKNLRVVVCLGKIAFDGFLAHARRSGLITSRAGMNFRARRGVYFAEWDDGDGQLSSLAAKHQHRQADAAHAAEDFQAGKGSGGVELRNCAGRKLEE
jgi:uracil-DNA glycosylase